MVNISGHHGLLIPHLSTFTHKDYSLNPKILVHIQDNEAKTRHGNPDKIELTSQYYLETTL